MHAALRQLRPTPSPRDRQQGSPPSASSLLITPLPSPLAPLRFILFPSGSSSGYFASGAALCWGQEAGAACPSSAARAPSAPGTCFSQQQVSLACSRVRVPAASLTCMLTCTRRTY
eukprot:41328-Rhodomonas_salina.1